MHSHRMACEPYGAVVRLFRALGFVAVTVPAVLVVHGLVGGALPSLPLLLVAAVLAGMAGWCTSGRDTGVVTASLAGVQLLLHSLLYVGSGQPSTGCLPAIGRGARLGVDFALLRPATACGPDGYAVGVGGYAAVATVLVAVTLVAGQLLTAAVGMLALRVVEAWCAMAQALVRLVSPIVLTPVPLTPRLPLRPAPLLSPAVQSPFTRPFLRRGPPAAVRALTTR